MDDGSVNFIFSSYKSKFCFGYFDLDLRIEFFKKKFDLKEKFTSFYIKKEEFLYSNLYFIQEK